MSHYASHSWEGIEQAFHDLFERIANIEDHLGVKRSNPDAKAAVQKIGEIVLRKGKISKRELERIVNEAAKLWAPKKVVKVGKPVHREITLTPDQFSALCIIAANPRDKVSRDLVTTFDKPMQRLAFQITKLRK